jgi:hypothetical protein
MNQRVIANPLRPNRFEENNMPLRSPEEEAQLQKLLAENNAKLPDNIPTKIKVLDNPGSTVSPKELGDISDSIIEEAQEKNPAIPPTPKQVEKLITNVSPNAPVAPPPITPEQRRKFEQKVKDKDEEVYAGKPRLITKPVNRDINFQRIDLLSGFIFYPFKECMIRKINIQDHLKLMSAQKTRNLTLFIDTIGSTLGEGVDVRSLALQDFYFILYWHRFNSYSSTPLTVNWVSKYGNNNTYKVKSTSIKYTPPKITEEEYNEWFARGYSIPTVRDTELFNREKLSDEDLELAFRAQFFSGYHSEFDSSNGAIPDLDDKIKHMLELNADSVDSLGLVNEFIEATQFSVAEYIDVTDAKFDVENWKKELEKRIELTREAAEQLDKNSPEYFIELETISYIQNEIDEINAKLEKGGKVLPDVERVPLKIEILDMFPQI